MRRLKATGSDKLKQTTESTRANLAAELQTVQSTSSSANVEVQSLRDQVARVERSNRDTLAVLESRNTAHDKLAEELAAQHQKTITSRREIASLEERHQSTATALASANFREHNLQQEVDLLKRNNEWFDSELKTKSGEYAKFRKERTARIADLNRSNEDITSNLEIAQRAEKTLRNRLDELGEKADAAFTKIQSMQEDASRAEESFNAELDSARRLASLYEQSMHTARRRVQELEDTLEQNKSDAATEIGQIQAELESERQGREAAEQRVEQLEDQFEALETQHGVNGQVSAQGTPRRTTRDLVAMTTPIRAMSPGAQTLGSTRSRGGLSFTQMYAEHTSMKSELEAERRRNAKLSATMDEMIQDLEKREPELQELQLEHEKLQAEIAHLSSALARTGQEKEAMYKESRKWQSQVEGMTRESDLLRQQLRDLSAQIKVLLVEVQVRSEGAEFSASERTQLQQAARGEVDIGALDGMSDTGQFITQRLTTFKNLFELQETNAKLLYLTRQLGEQMEGEEAQAQRSIQEQQRQELDTMRARVEQYKDEMKSLITQSQSYIRERDMFRRMLSHRGHLPQDGDTNAMFGSSVNMPGTPRTPHFGRQSTVDDSQLSTQLAENGRVLKELQSHFDAYRQEAATDHATLREQSEQLAKEKSDLQHNIARAGSQLTLSQERYDMLQSNYQMLKTEIEEMQKRSNSLNEVAARQDIRTQQVAEELVEARGLSEALRNENANLKAEKDLWKKIEHRLSDDNHNLTEERRRLNKLIVDTQNLANERELSGTETRRKFQSQLEALDSDSRLLKQKLEEEIDENKKTILRRDYEQEQSRSRHDDLMRGMNAAKEELVIVRTVRDQLQARVDEMKSELRTAEDRVRDLQSVSASASARPTASLADDAQDEAASRVQIVELSTELERAKSALESAQAQVEQYKAISQSSEEELQSINESADQYREHMDGQIAERDAKINDLQQRVQDISTELSATVGQLGELRGSAEESQARLDQQTTAHEAELSRIREESERFEEMAKFYQGDLKAQAEIAQQAQQSYDNELVKHAEAAKSLQKLREDFNLVRLQLTEARADADAARTTLGQSEDSWSSSREFYERELAEIKVRRNEVDAQNKVLHQQLENVSQQITALQQRRNQAGQIEEDVQSSENGLSNLQEVIKFLRREKEIVDVQYELSVQEARRLKQQLDYAQLQLDEARGKLDQERQRQSDAERNLISHAKLMDTINELNVFRESSVTLRAEARQAQSQVAGKTAQLEELSAQLQPLQLRVRDLEGEHDIAHGEMKLLREDRERWQQRAQNILQKYDRIDPAELEGLKEQLSSLKEEQEEWSKEKLILQERIDKIPDEIVKAQEEVVAPLRSGREKLIEQFKGRSKELSAKIRGMEAENRSLTSQLDSVKEELNASIAARDAAVASVKTAELNQTSQTTANSEAVVENDEPNSAAEDGEISADGAVSSYLETQLPLASSRLEEELMTSGQLQQEVARLQANVGELESKLNDVQQELESSQSELNALQKHDENAVAARSEELEQLKASLLSAQNEMETLRVAPTVSAAPVASTEDVQSVQPAAIAEQTDVENKVKAQLEVHRATLDSEYQQKTKSLEETFSTRAANMRTQLTNKLKDAREKLGHDKDEALQKLQEEHAAQLAQLQTDHAAQLLKIQSEHANQISELNAGHNQEIASLKTLSASKPGAQPDSGSVLEAAKTVGPTLVQDPNSTSEAPDSSAKIDKSTVENVLNLSPSQIQTLLRENFIVKNIVTKNIKTRLDQEVVKVKKEHEKYTADKVDEEVSKVKADQEQLIAARLEDAKLRFESIKEQAVIVEGKKWTAKFSMAEGRARTALAKIEIFRKAADDTPQKPIAEVWAIAKDFKPPPVPQAATPASSGIPLSDGSRLDKGSANTPKAPSAESHEMKSETFSSALNSNSAGAALANQPTKQQSSVPAIPAALVVSNNGTAQVMDETSNDSKVQPTTTGTGPGALRSILAQGSGIPRGGGGTRGAGMAGRGGGRGGNTQVLSSSNAAQGSNLPAPASNLPTPAQSGASNRGGAAAGSRGSRGRGQGPGHNTTPTGSPGRGGPNMNASARQFVPNANKRPRETSTEGGDGSGSGGKRPRGGGGGGGGQS